MNCSAQVLNNENRVRDIMLSRDDQQLIDRDSTLPGLRVLLDEEVFCSALASHFPLKPSEIQIDYIRYKPRTSCLVGVILGAGENRKYLSARACRRGDIAKFAKSAKRSVNNPELQPTVLEEHSIIVSFFPDDRRLQTLSALSQPESRRDVLARLFPTKPRYWEGNFRWLRYKPERRFVGQLMLDQQPAAVLKLHTAGNYRLACTNAKVFRSGNTLLLPQRIARSQRHHIVAYEWLAGTLLSELLNAGNFSSAQMAQVGYSLSVLHTQYSRHLRYMTREDEVRSLTNVADGIAFLHPGLAKRLRLLTKNLTEQLLETPNPGCGIHGDFYPCQVLCQNDRFAFIDLDRALCGDPAADLGNFIAHLEWNAIQGYLPMPQVAEMSDALLSGYKGSRYHTAIDRVHFYIAAGLLQLAPRPFRDRNSRWVDKTEMLVDRANSILNSSDYTIRRSHAPNCRMQSVYAPSVAVSDQFRITDDSGMPFAAEALDPVAAERDIGCLVEHSESGNTIAGLKAIRVTRHKAGRRCIIEYEFDSKHTELTLTTYSIVGKVRVKGTDKRTYELTKSLWNLGFHETNEDRISVPEPIGTISKWNMVLNRKVSGRPASLLLPSPEGPVLAERIAEAAHKIHSTEVPCRRVHTIADELRILQKKLPLVSRERPQWTGRLQGVLDACDRLAKSVATPKPCGIHRDFYPDQVIVQGDRLYILDFDLYCIGDPALDIGNFRGHLVEQSIRQLGDPEALFHCEEALESRFLQLAGSHLKPAIDAYTTLTLVRHIYLSTQFPKRRRFTETMLELCEARLGIGKEMPIGCGTDISGCTEPMTIDKPPAKNRQ